MAVQISCSDLGIQGCNFSATGETPGQVIREVVEHVQAEHNINLPDTNTILDGKIQVDYFGGNDPGAEIIVKRLIEKLDTYPPSGPDLPAPSIGRTPNQ